MDLTTQKILFKQFHELVFRTAYKYCGNRDDAEEIVQETFIRAFTNISSFIERENGSFESWLVTICKNIAINFIKRKMKCNEIPSEEVILDRELFSKELAASAERIAIEKLKIEDIREALREIPEEKRQVVILRIYHGLSHQEIAQLIGLKENHVRIIYHRALQLIRTLLQEKWGAREDE